MNKAVFFLMLGLAGPVVASGIWVIDGVSTSTGAVSMAFGTDGGTAYRGDWGLSVSNLASGAVQRNHTGDVSVLGNVTLGMAFGTNTISGDTQIGNSERRIDINQKGMFIMDVVSENIEFAVEQYAPTQWHVDLKGNAMTNAGPIRAQSLQLGDEVRSSWPEELYGANRRVISVREGDSIMTKYAQAVTGGASATRRIALVIWPGTYHMSGTLIAGTEFVDIVSKTGNRDVFITGGNINFEANSILVRGLDFTGTNEGYLRVGNNKPLQVFENVRAGSWPTSFFSHRPFTGTMRRCEVGNYLGRSTTLSGTFVDCVIGDYFGEGGSMSGTVIDSVIGQEGLRFATFTGQIINSTLGNNFMTSGQMRGTVRGCVMLGAYGFTTGDGAYVNCRNAAGELFSLGIKNVRANQFQFANGAQLLSDGESLFYVSSFGETNQVAFGGGPAGP